MNGETNIKKKIVLGAIAVLLYRCSEFFLDLFSVLNFWLYYQGI